MSCLKTPGERGGGGNPYDSLYGEAPTRKGYLFQASAIKKVEILPVEVYERVRKSVIWVCKRAQRAEQKNFMALTSRVNVLCL